MKQIVYEIVVFLHLIGYNKDSKLKLLSDMYNNQVEIENEALINIIKSIKDELIERNTNESIISIVQNYIDLINKESQY
ncbi:hypothetical protein [Methanosphaera sp.]|uniref:hypothetical protein n=1 Tax=Methanosphaera sp. TaxID=2666342 RepID=UPI002E78F37C|nr:hypothetical protein [Methanosphaera sp.]MEE1117005.1 hypothetical protein [Methanosphaera sp.]